MKRYLISAAFLAGLGFTACDGNDETPGPDTVRPDTTDTTDTAGDTDTDTTNPVDTIPPPDVIEEPEATVKYARTLVAQGACDADFRNDIDPQSKLDDVIVTSPVYEVSAATETKPATFGFYVADAAGGAYSGILVVANAPKPEIAPGDVVDVSGQLMEAFCNAQVSNATVTKKSTGTAPSPLVQNATDLPQDAYEGMLVKVVDAEIEPASASGGKRIKGTNLPIGFVFDGFIGLNDGSTYDITGIIRSTRFNGVEGFQLVPRGPSDVVLKNAAANSIVGIQSTDISKTCPSPAPSFQNGLSGIQIEGTVQTGRFSASGALFGYYLTDETTAPYSGILLVQDKTPAPATEFVKGDRVRVIGRHVEYFCMTQFQISSIEKIGDGGTFPSPVVIDKTITKADLEQWEGVLVEVADVAAGAFVEKNAAGQNVYFVDTDTNFKIDSLLIGSAFQNGAAITNKTLTTLRGIVRYSFDEYRISPRSTDDWVIAP